jgi:predicted transglutaminase-like cysteine proteinase
VKRLSEVLPMRAKRLFVAAVLCVGVLGMWAKGGSASSGGEAPGWMHAVVNAPVPAHDEKTDAVKMWAEKIVTVQSADKIKMTVRVAYKILRPGGRDLGTVAITFDSSSKITALRAWCIPAQGKDYEVKDKEAIEMALPAVPGSELITDVRAKVVKIPAADVGNIVGYEYEKEMRPMVLQDGWYFQGSYPTREEHYTLQLPAGWEYKAAWLNHAEVAPASPTGVGGGGSQWHWVVSGVPGIRSEEEMPPRSGIAGQMILTFFPAGGATGKAAFGSWSDMGVWYNDLTRNRREASAEITQKTSALTASAQTSLQKMQAIATFVQRDIRYVAIELGIGGQQPHPAPEIFSHRYGDCKDKATLMSTMLKTIGIDSYYVLINTERDSVTPEMPAHVGGFDHAILAVKLPNGVEDGSLAAVLPHAKLGRLLFFDPTDELTPFGRLSGPLQANYGLVVGPEGGYLIDLPQLPAVLNGIRRMAKLTLSPNGTLSGDVLDERVGDAASRMRYSLKTVSKDADRIKPIETLLAQSLSSYQLTKAAISNLEHPDLPFDFSYSLVSPNYAKSAGGLLLVRPRVLGHKSSDLLETKEPRQYPVVFDGPAMDIDTFEITLPTGYEVDDLPPPVNADYSFASYHSKVEAKGNMLRYTRTLEVKEPSVPLSKVSELKNFYRVIAGDERNTAVLRTSGQ